MYENANKELGELIFQLAQGSMSAFEQIYKQTGKILYRLGNSYFTQRADVEDAVQDTYLEIYKKAGKFRDNQNACAWITKISQNLIKNRLKRRKRIDYRETEEIKNIFWKNGEEEPILESRIFLSDLFKNLDCYERARLTYRYKWGCSLREMSEILCRPKSTIADHLHKLTEKIKFFIN